MIVKRLVTSKYKRRSGKMRDCKVCKEEGKEGWRESVCVREREREREKERKRKRKRERERKKERERERERERKRER